MKVTWQEIEKGCRAIYSRLPKKKYEAIVCIASGGLIPGKILSELLDLPLGIVVMQRYKRGGKGKLLSESFTNTNIIWIGERLKGLESILVVDDIIDSGITMQKVTNAFRSFTSIKNIDIAVLYYKSTKLDFKKYRIYKFATCDSKTWVEFPWEK